MFPAGRVHGRHVRLSLVPDIGVDVCFPKVGISDIFHFCDITDFPEQYDLLARTVINKAQKDIALYYSNITKKILVYVGLENPEVPTEHIKKEKLNERLFNLMIQRSKLKL
jgi:hypothetical protein